jgi:hypothetical protein
MNAKEFHHFFPQEFLTKKKIPANQINCLANIILLTSASNKKISARAPSDYLTEVVAAAGAHLPQWLASNLIPEAALQAALRDDFDSFLMMRSQAIHERVCSLAQW